MNQGEQNWSQEFSETLESQYEKQEKKQKLVRNEFQKTGKYGIPLIKKQHIDTGKIEPWGYSKTKKNDEENKHKTIHFFTYDWLFETVYSKPEAAVEKLEQYYALLTPDFSTYIDMPKALQINSVFKNRWCGAYWQQLGMRVIPTICWGDKSSFEFCFDGVERESIVAISTYRREGYIEEYMLGYNKMLEVISPSAIICYGDLFPDMRGNVKALSPYNHEKLISTLGLNEYLKRRTEGSLYPSN